MRRIWWGTALGLVPLLGLVGSVRADSAGELRTLYRAKADSRDVLLAGRYPVPVSAQSFVKVLTTYSPPPKKR